MPSSILAWEIFVLNHGQLPSPLDERMLLAKGPWEGLNTGLAHPDQWMSEFTLIGSA